MSTSLISTEPATGNQLWSGEPGDAAGKDKKDDKGGIHRYLFVMARLNKDAVKRPELVTLPDLPPAKSDAPATDAPATPGEVKVTLKTDPLPGEASLANKEISTYLTVTKEGLSVLLVDRLRTELKFIREALAGDPRIRVFEAVRQTDDVPAGDDIFNFDKQAYDVIVLGYVTAKRLLAADPQAL